MSDDHDIAEIALGKPASERVGAAPVAPNAEKDGDGLTRRQFALRALVCAGAGMAVAVGLPVVGFAAAPGMHSRVPRHWLSTSIAPTLRSDSWSSVGALADFDVGVPKYVKVERHVVDGWVQENEPVGIHVVRQPDDQVVVFDPHCTHLGCPLAWSDGAGAFVCPCHGGSFSVDGDVLSGPPPLPMFRYETKIENGEVLIGGLPDRA